MILGELLDISHRLTLSFTENIFVLYEQNLFSTYDIGNLSSGSAAFPSTNYL